jgi:hypothetical protein
VTRGAAQRAPTTMSRVSPTPGGRLFARLPGNASSLR